MNNQAGFTLYGIENYLQHLETPISILTGATVYPGGTYGTGTEYETVIPKIDKDVLQLQILEDWGEFLVWRQNPDMFLQCVNNFFKKNYDNFARIWTALHMDYNPLYNYDRYEDSKNTYDSYNEETDRKTWTDETTETPTGKETRETTHASDEVVETKLSADGSNVTYDPKEKVTTTLAPDKTDLTFTNRQTVTEMKRKNPQGTLKNDHKGDDSFELHARGNIGTTRSAEMLNDEISVRQFDFYKMVADKFAHELLLIIY